MNNARFLLLVFVMLISNMSVAQSNTHVGFQAYSELYYSLDIANTSLQQKPDFIYNYKRLNELNINLLVGKVTYTDANTRANIGLMLGNYAQYNLATEPDWAKFVYEANMGVKIGKTTWLDAGIMPSHIGFESAIGADCWTLTRSLLAENSPYYETGVKISGTNKQATVYGAILLLNGWQRIERMEGATLPSVGTQLTYTPSERLLINYSTYFGDEKPNAAAGIRTFHNFYAILTPERKVNFQLGFDLGTEYIESEKVAVWYSPVIISRFAISEKSKLAIRAEKYSDKNKIIFGTDEPNGSVIYGFSSNFDYSISEKIRTRIEAKKLISSVLSPNFTITSSLLFKL